MPTPSHLGESLEALVQVLKELREKCPWDKVQTNESLRRFTIEELYELLEALASDDANNIKEELGDMCTHIIFYANIAEEKGQFSLQEVLDYNRRKLISRHPHIYGDGSVEMKDDKAVEKNWEKLKGKEGKSMFSGLPQSLPAMTKAHKLIDKSNRFGFRWATQEDALQKIYEEIDEVKASLATHGTTDKETEIGDLLLAVIGYAHYLEVDPDRALSLANQKFQKRIEAIEQKLSAQGKTMNDCTLKELQQLWSEVK